MVLTPVEPISLDWQEGMEWKKLISIFLFRIFLIISYVYSYKWYGVRMAKRKNTLFHLVYPTDSFILFILRK